MKKFFVFLMIAIFGASMLTTSCKKNEVEEPIAIEKTEKSAIGKDEADNPENPSFPGGGGD